jgi:hypothetical protein
MSRTAPRSIFGVHGVTPYNRTTGLPYGELRVTKGSSISMQGEQQDLLGGSSKYPWASEEGAITAEMTLNVGELPNFMFTLFLGTAPTDNAAELTTGNISTLTDKKGTSIVDATNGIASVHLLSGSAANLKFGKYVIKAVSTNTFNVYYLTGIDSGRGTDIAFLTDDMCVASAVAFTASVASVPALGIAWAMIGTPAFVSDDTAEFTVRPLNSLSTTVRIGGITSQSFPEFGALVYAQKRGNGEMIEFDMFRCKGAGMPLPLEMGAFAAFEVKVKCLYDDAKDGLFDMRHISPT